MSDPPAAETRPPSRPSGGGIFDEPSISRQWVARRLQRALALERWGGAVRRGFAALPAPSGPLLDKHADAATARAAGIHDLISDIGAKPYGYFALGGAAARGTAKLVALAVRPLARKLAYMLAEHTLSEYESLGALLEDAPGVSPAVGAAIAPLHAEVGEEFHDLSRISRSS